MIKEVDNMRKNRNKTYKLNISNQDMKQKGFRYDFLLQEYAYEFPVYKYNKKPTIVCKLGVDNDTNNIWFNVYDIKGNLYPPYYNREYGKSKVIDIIDKNITKEFRKLGIESR